MKNAHIVLRKLAAAIISASMALSPPLSSAASGNMIPFLLVAEAEALSEQPLGNETGENASAPVISEAVPLPESAPQPEPAGDTMSEDPLPQPDPENTGAATDVANPEVYPHGDDISSPADSADTPPVPSAEGSTDEIPVPAASETAMAASESEKSQVSEPADDASATPANAPGETLPQSGDMPVSAALPEPVPGDTDAGPIESFSETAVEDLTEAAASPETESLSETESETVTEAETESESESESETEEDEPHSILFEAQDGVNISLHEDRLSYREGEQVTFDVTTADGYDLASVSARSVTILSAEESSGTAGLGTDTTGAMASGGALVLIEGETLRLTQTASSRAEMDPGAAQSTAPASSDSEETSAAPASADAQDPGHSDESVSDTFTFTMPGEDVILMAATQLAAPASTSVELEYGGIKNIPPSWTPDGMEWARGRTIIGYSVYRTVTMPDGSTRICYCLQPVLGADDAGDYTARRLTGSALLQKALFYCYGGPGWNAGGLKSVLSDCDENDEYYVASHFIVSQIYLGKNGKWNKVISSNTEYDAMNARGESQINAAVEAISSLPDPKAELSTTQVSGSYDKSSGYAVTQSVRYTSTIAGNTLRVTLPDGVYLVSGSGEYAPGQRATIEPGESFYLKKKGYSAAHSQTLTLTAAIATDFAAYLINVGADRQNMGFSYVADKTFSLEVTWPDLLTCLQILKVDSLTGTASPVNENYSLDGAVYGIYEDAACTKLLEELTISGGSARSSENYVIGTTYYIREISAPARYQPDPKVYPVTAAADGKAGITSSEVPKAFSIQVFKTDAETGERLPQTAALSFAGARFGIYTDESCQIRASDMNGSLLPDLVTGEDGAASTPCSLLIRDYWVKELEPPTGYLLNQEVFHISAGDAAAAAVSDAQVISLNVAQQIIRGNVSLMKIKNDKDQSVRPAGGITFRFTYTADESVSFSVSDAGPNLIVTDEEGFATTESAALPRGTLIYGEWRITEENPPEGYEAIAPMTVMVGANSRTYRYTANDRHIYAALLIEKHDANTGSLLPVPGVSFRILHADNMQPVELFDAGTRSYVSIWTTDADGVVQLPDTIPYGSYILQEDPATIPEGYFVMEDTPFTVSESSEDPLSPLVITAQEPPQTGRITVRKAHADTGEPLEGFTFLIRAADDITDLTGAVRPGEDETGTPCLLTAGTVVERITTDESGTAVSKDLYLGRYTVEEVSGAGGFAILADAQSVTLAADKTAALEGKGVSAETGFENHPTTLEIFKKASGSGQPLSGVRFKVSQVAGADPGVSNGADQDAPTGADQTAADGGVQTASAANTDTAVDENAASSEYITDASGRILIEKLPAGTTWEVSETGSLPGYNPDTTTVTFSVDEHGLIDGSWKKELVFTNVPNVLTISKQSITGGEEIPGATLTITDEGGNTVAEWVSEDTPHVITAIPAGSYTLTEKLPAPGYTTAESIRFTVTDQLTVQGVTMKDDVTKVQISKSDITNGEPVEGATLIITDSTGNEVARWITTKDPHYIEKLPVGSYTLTEITAPKGYAVAESVSFEVKDHGEIQKVVMYDKPENVKGNKTKKKVKKTAVMNRGSAPSAPSPGGLTAGSAPRTGDTTDIALPLLAALLSLLLIAGTILLRRKKHAG